VVEVENTEMEMLAAKVRPMLEQKERMHRLCGLDESAFKILVNDFKKPFEQLNWRAEHRVKTSNVPDLPADVALWVTLYWMRQYPTGVTMELLFGVHERTLGRVFKRTVAALMTTFHDELKWPSDDELRSWKQPSHMNTPLEDIVCYADGTVLNGPRSILKFAPGANDPYFNYAKHKHGINVVCIVNPYGKIIWSTDWQRGGTTDQQIAISSFLRGDFLNKDFGIAADGGFTFNKKDEPEPIITAKPYKHNQMVGTEAEVEAMKTFNKNLSSNRVIVENVFLRLNQWRRISGYLRHFHPNSPSRGNLLALNHIVQCLCTLHNRVLTDHPMRA
jgi:hypothetical protein